MVSKTKPYNAKPIWKSKTFWFNVATTCVAVANEMMPVVGLMEGETAELIRAGLIVVLSVGNTILRVVTSKPVHF